MQTTQHQPWMVASVHHEGAPLLLRVRVGADTPGRRAEFGRLAIIVQSLDRVRPDGEVAEETTRIISARWATKRERTTDEAFVKEQR